MENETRIELQSYEKKSLGLIPNVNKIKKRGKLMKNKLKTFFNGNKNKTNLIKKDINNKDKTNIQPEIKKVRNPGVDLLRIISMYNIIFHHCLGHGNGFSHFRQFNREINILHSITGWHNNGFILISGIVGYKTNKYSNLLYLWLTVFFYSVGIPKYFMYFRKDLKRKIVLYKEYFPIIFNRYWFFTSYFAMYLYLPIFNKGIEYLTKYELRLVVMSTIGILVFWRDYKNPREDIFFLNNGGSVLWFFIFYLTGSFIGKYRINYTGFKKYIYCFLCILIFSFASHIYYKLMKNEFFIIIGKTRINFPNYFIGMLTKNYNSLLAIVQSISASLFFLQIHYNKYLAKIISFFGPLIFGVYLIHDNEIVRGSIIRTIYDNKPKNLNVNTALGLMLGTPLKIFIFCITIDYFRHLLFTLLRLKKIFLFLETKIKAKFIK